MCDCFSSTDVEVEHLPPRYYGGPGVKRMSFVRDPPTTYRSSNEVMLYSPRSSSNTVRNYSQPRYSQQYLEDDATYSYRSPRRPVYNVRTTVVNHNRRFIPLAGYLPREEDEDDGEITVPQRALRRRGRSRDTGPMVVHGGGSRRRRADDYSVSDEYSDDSWTRRSPRYSHSDDSEDSWSQPGRGGGRRR